MHVEVRKQYQLEAIRNRHVLRLLLPPQNLQVQQSTRIGQPQLVRIDLQEICIIDLQVILLFDRQDVGNLV